MLRQSGAVDEPGRQQASRTRRAGSPLSGFGFRGLGFRGFRGFRVLGFRV